MADNFIDGIIDDAREEVEGERRIKKQGERCREMFEARSEELLGKMNDKDRKGLVENGSQLARRWMGLIPWNKTQLLNNQQISAALHYRTLIPGSIHCPRCGTHSAELGHSETCDPYFKYARHNAVVHALGHAVQSRGVRVEYEPTSTDNNQKRNDLRVWASGIIGTATTEHDIKVYSIFTEDAYSSFGNPRLEAGEVMRSTKRPEWERVRLQAEGWLKKIAKKTTVDAPGGVGTFTPMVFSTGGFIQKEAKKQMDEWQSGISEGKWAWMMKRISLSLVKMRAQTMTW